MTKTEAIQLDVRIKNVLETPTDLDRKGVAEITEVWIDQTERRTWFLSEIVRAS